MRANDLLIIDFEELKKINLQRKHNKEAIVKTLEKVDKLFFLFFTYSIVPNVLNAPS